MTLFCHFFHSNTTLWSLLISSFQQTSWREFELFEAAAQVFWTNGILLHCWRPRPHHSAIRNLQAPNRPSEAGGRGQQGSRRPAGGSSSRHGEAQCCSDQPEDVEGEAASSLLDLKDELRFLTKRVTLFFQRSGTFRPISCKSHGLAHIHRWPEH